MDNEFIIQGDVVYILMFDKSKSESGRAIIDIDDFERCKIHHWYKDSKGYARTTILGKKIRLHKYVTNTDKNVLIDHIDRDKLNCRKSNLRVCSYSLNSRNRERQTNNTSDNPGVSYHITYKPTNSGYWFARYTNRDLGLSLCKPYKNKSEAIKQRTLWEKKYGGDML